MSVSRLIATCVVVLLGVGLCVICPSASATVLVNGDFEDTTVEFPLNSGWEVATVPAGRENPAVTHPGLVAGSSTAALLKQFPEFGTGGQGALWQGFADTGPNWELDFYFATENPGALGTRALNMGIRPNAGGDSTNQINLRVSGDGTLQAHDQTAGWSTIASNVISYSADAGGNDNFTDAGDTLNVHRIRFVGHYGDAAPNYDVMISDAGSDDVNDNVFLAQTFFSAGGAPPQGSGLQTITLEQSSDSTGAYILDNMTLIPEPGTLGLLCVGWLMALALRSRRELG